MIRPVRIADAQAIVDLYNYYIRETIITFETETLGLSEMEERIRRIERKRHPFLVYEEKGAVCGYAYASSFRERPAYDITLETSIYLAPSLTGQGIGTRLYHSLIRECVERGIHSLVGSIALPNEASEYLHRKLGFERIGVFREVGQKAGLLIDVVFWQLRLKTNNT